MSFVRRSSFHLPKCWSICKVRPVHPDQGQPENSSRRCRKQSFEQSATNLRKVSARSNHTWTVNICAILLKIHWIRHWINSRNHNPSAIMGLESHWITWFHRSNKDRCWKSFLLVSSSWLRITEKIRQVRLSWAAQYQLDARLNCHFDFQCWI